MLTNLPAYIANARKAIIQFATLVITIGTIALTFQSSMPKEYAAAIVAVVAFAGLVIHYITPNADAPGTVAAVESPDGSYDISTLPADDDVADDSVTADDVADEAGEHRALVDENDEPVSNEEPEDHELDEGPIVSEIPVKPNL